MIKELILKNRSCRRFHQDVAIELETLRELVDLARFAATGSNRQPLKYILSCTPERNAQIFPTILNWRDKILTRRFPQGSRAWRSGRKSPGSSCTARN